MYNLQEIPVVGLLWTWQEACTALQACSLDVDYMHVCGYFVHTRTAFMHVMAQLSSLVVG